MKKILKAITGLSLAAIMTAAPFAAAAAESAPALPESIQQGTVLHCFAWRFNDIREELPNIAKAGFTAVQTSPFQFSFYGGESGIYYSPFSFALNNESELGTREDLKNLCSEADKYGIKVIVDVVANHLAGIREFWNSDDPDEISYSEILEGEELFDDKYLSAEYWHNHGNIRGYTERSEITNGDFNRYIPDLNTENHEVQSDVRQMIADYKALGVDGFRWDAAKHIALPSEGSDFWPNVIDSSMYNYGEILGGPCNDSNYDYLMEEYSRYMSVTDSSYGSLVLDKFKSGKATERDGNWNKRGVASDKLMYWAETHDTFREGQTLNVSQNIIDRTYAVVASREGASALYFSRPPMYDGAAYTGEKGSTHFTSLEVAAVNNFHNAMVGKADCLTAGDNCTVVTRDGGGAVLALGTGSGKVTVPNGKSYVPVGNYIDEVSGNVFTVTADSITGTIGESGIAVIYNKTDKKPAEETTSAPSTTAAPEGTKAAETTAPSTQPTTSAGGTVVRDNSNTSPKTGDPGTPVLLIVFSAAALTSMGIAIRKRKEK